MPKNSQTNPWGDAANQAVGALYKYYMSQPTAADMQKVEYMRSQTEGNQLDNAMTQRMYDAGVYPNMPAPMQNMIERERRQKQAPDSVQIFDAYVNPYQKFDSGDVQGAFNPNTGDFDVKRTTGTPPRFEMDKEGNRALPVPAIPSQGVRSSMADALMPYLVNQESGGDPMALSPKGAAGLTQIMPDTARDPGFGVAPLAGWDGVDPRTAPPEEQLRFGRDYLAAMIDKNGGNPALGLAAYNAGPGAVEQHGGIPPYSETQQYVQNIMGKAGTLGQPVQQSNGIINYPQSTADIGRENDKNFSQNATMDDLNQTFASAMFNISQGGAGLGSYMKDIPLIGGQTKAGTLEADLSKITNKAALDKIAQYKDESKTGGFFGNLSDGERQAVADSQLSIRQSMNQQELAYRLAMHQDLVNDIIHGRGKTLPGTNQVVPMDAGAPRSGLPTFNDITNATSVEELTAMWDAFDRIPAFGGKPPDFIEQALVQKVNQLRGGQ